jgi:hypothetical protein
MRARCLFAPSVPVPVFPGALTKPDPIPTAPQPVGLLIAGPS